MEDYPRTLSDTKDSGHASQVDTQYLKFHVGRTEYRSLDASSPIVPLALRITDLRHATEADSDPAGHGAFQGNLTGKSHSCGHVGRGVQHLLRPAGDNPTGIGRGINHGRHQFDHCAAVPGGTVVGTNQNLDA